MAPAQELHDALPAIAPAAAELPAALAGLVDAAEAVPGFGAEGLRRVAGGHVLVIGDDHLAAAIAQALTEAGVAEVTSVAELSPVNAIHHLMGHHVAVAATRSGETRSLAAAAGSHTDTPVVVAASGGLAGVVSVCWPDAPGGGFRLDDIEPIVPALPKAPALPLTDRAIAAAAALETVKLLAGFGEVLLGRVAVFDGADGSWREVRPAGQVRQRARASWHSVTATEATTSQAAAPAQPRRPRPAESMLAGLRELTPQELAEALASDTPPQVIDLRERDEYRPVQLDEAIWLPMSELLSPGGMDALPTEGPLVFLCAHGVRSLQVAGMVSQSGRDAASLAGGAEAWGYWAG